jgi:hypothetical protein
MAQISVIDVKVAQISVIHLLVEITSHFDINITKFSITAHIGWSAGQRLELWRWRFEFDSLLGTIFFYPSNGE